MDTKKWYKSFMDDQAEYTKQRAKHEKTPNEKKKWTSVKQLKKAATDLKKRFRYILEAPPTESLQNTMVASYKIIYTDPGKKRLSNIKA